MGSTHVHVGDLIPILPEKVSTVLTFLCHAEFSLCTAQQLHFFCYLINTGSVTYGFLADNNKPTRGIRLTAPRPSTDHQNREMAMP